jgi:outer membrane protein assembly factor BamB
VTDPAGSSEKRRIWRQVFTCTAGVALLFSVFVSVEMFQIWRQMKASNPLDHPRLIALRGDLARQPESNALKEEIRIEEAALRERFLVNDKQLRDGAWLLLVGLAIFALAGRTALGLRQKLPIPVMRTSTYDPDRRLSLPGRVAVLAMTLLLIAAAATIPLLRERDTTIENARGIWARFRGPGGLGISPYAEAPLDFDAREGQERNIRWKAVTPLPGLSSPVIWNDRVFLTGALPSSREVYCFDALTGKLLWRRPVSAGPESSQVPENVYSETGYAAPTPVTDGRHVWALFANGDVVCLDLFGKTSWCVNMGLPQNMYGLAASPTLLDGKLVLQIDQDYGDDDKPRSALIALNAETGEVAWKTARDVESSWPSPIVIQVASEMQIITCANPWTIAYEPEKGSEIWRVDCLEGDGGPSPSFGEGFVLAVNVGSPLVAIRPNGKGDVTKSHVVWRYDDGLPDVCSPLAGRGMVWLQSSDGFLTCLDGKTGKKLWDNDLGMNVYSSPALAGDRIYVIGRKGKLVVLAAEGRYRELATGHLGEECDASPAFAENRMYVRGKKHLFCMEQPGS